MSKNLQILSGLIIVGFLLLVVGMAALSGLRPNNGVMFATGGIERATDTAESAGLTVTAVAPLDVYGEEYTVAFPVCPRSTPESVMETTGLPSAPVGLPDVVDQDTNYLVLVRPDGSSDADAISRDSIDLCAGSQIPPFSTASILPLVQDEEGTWVLMS